MSRPGGDVLWLLSVDEEWKRETRGGNIDLRKTMDQGQMLVIDLEIFLKENLCCGRGIQPCREDMKKQEKGDTVT